MLGGSLRLAKIAGIDVFVHWSFALLLAFVGFSQFAAGLGWAIALESMAFLLAVFGCVLLHEFGHAMAGKMYGIGTRDITLLPIGGLARLERMPEAPGQELVVALAGPAVNVVIAAGLFLVLLAMGTVGALTQVAVISGSFLARLMWVNVALVVFNMLPAFPMDGGRVLRALMAMMMDRGQATRVASVIGQLMAVLFMVAGAFLNGMLILVGLFIFFAARSEAAQVALQLKLKGAVVGQAMLTRFRALSADEPLESAMLSDSQQDFPVVVYNRVVGMVDQEDVVAGLRSQPRLNFIGEVMRAAQSSVQETDALDSTVQWMQSNGCSAIPVLRNRELVGLLTLPQLSHWLHYREAPAAA